MRKKKKKKSKKKNYIYIFFEKIYRVKLSKLSVSYYVLIKKSSFLGHFCVTHSQTHSLTDSQTDGRTDGKVELQSCVSQLKITQGFCYI